MKTKKLFLMAAMLLMSMCMFAQNNTPLKGDVNEDGTVDVADLVAVMQIMKDAGGAVGEKMYYWYAGVNGGSAVTEANFTDVASKIAESQIPETGFVTASGQYVYIVMPETQYLSDLMDANGNAVDYDCTDAYGYHIYKTQNKYSGKLNYGIAERIYYWYVGPTTPTSVDINNIKTSPSEIGWHIIEGTPTSIHIGQVVNDTQVNWVILIPTRFGITRVSSGGIDITSVYTVSTITIDGEVYRRWEQKEVSKKFMHDMIQ